MSLREQTELEDSALRLLRDQRLKRNKEMRSAAVRLIVRLLPKTFPVFEKLLADFTSPLWYEVHFTAFCALDGQDLGEADQRRVLTLIERYLANAKSESGYVVWKAGDLLGDEWHSPETDQILERLLFSAKHAPGRLGALYGVAHAMHKTTASAGQHLLFLVRKVALEDRSAEVRRYAHRVTEGKGCYKGKSAPPPQARMT
jgi:hypothetical protein